MTYWATRWGQNGELYKILHSAHPVLPQRGDISADVVAAKKRESYYDFCPEAKHSLLYAVAVVVLDIGGALLLLSLRVLFKWRPLCVADFATVEQAIRRTLRHHQEK